MKLKRPKAVYIQIREPGRPSRSLTVYDAGIDNVCTRIRRALSAKRDPKKSSCQEPAALSA